MRVERHWHVTERSGRMRVFAPRMRLVASMGADSASSAFSAFSRRANELMLDGWQLDVYGSDDHTITVQRDKETRVVEVYECYEAECLAGRPAPELGGIAQ